MRMMNKQNVFQYKMCLPTPHLDVCWQKLIERNRRERERMFFLDDSLRCQPLSQSVSQSACSKVGRYLSCRVEISNVYC